MQTWARVFQAHALSAWAPCTKYPGVTEMVLYPARGCKGGRAYKRGKESVGVSWGPRKGGQEPSSLSHCPGCHRTDVRKLFLREHFNAIGSFSD